MQCVQVKIIGSIHIFLQDSVGSVCDVCRQKNREHPYFFFQETVGRVCGASLCDVVPGLLTLTLLVA